MPHGKRRCPLGQPPRRQRRDTIADTEFGISVDRLVGPFGCASVCAHVAQVAPERGRDCSSYQAEKTDGWIGNLISCRIISVDGPTATSPSSTPEPRAKRLKCSMNGEMLSRHSSRAWLTACSL